MIDEQLVQFLTNHPLMSALWAGLLLALIYTTVSAMLSPVKTITPQQATLLVNRQDGIFVDTRSAEEFRKGHIIDSEHVTAAQIRDGEIGSLEKHKGVPIVVVCATGLSAKAAATQLYKAGFKQASVLQGGITGWKNASLPLTQKR